jgi:hypothetical protein
MTVFTFIREIILAVYPLLSLAFHAKIHLIVHLSVQKLITLYGIGGIKNT